MQAQVYAGHCPPGRKGLRGRPPRRAVRPRQHRPWRAICQPAQAQRRRCLHRRVLLRRAGRCCASPRAAACWQPAVVAASQHCA